MIGVILPIRRPRSRKKDTQQEDPISSPTIREVISANLEDIVQSALGLDVDDTLDGSSLNFGDTSSISSVAVDAGSSLDADIGLRHRSADGASDTQDRTPRRSCMKGDP